MTLGAESTSVVLQLKAERVELEPLNRTIRHCLHQASRRDLLPGDLRGQHFRCISSHRGVRRDVYFWDAWDRKVRGEDDLRKFFVIAERIGAYAQELVGSEVAGLLPGPVETIVGSRTELLLPDYWLYVVHNLGWTSKLPYECETSWSQGSSLADATYSMKSQLPVNIVQASIDALTVLIDSMPFPSRKRRLSRNCLDEEWVDDIPGPHWDRVKNSRPDRSPSITAHPPVTDPDEELDEASQPVRKRAERAVNIEALKKELAEHVRAARDHVQSALDFGHEPELLPRPTRRELAERVGITESAASRCFNDAGATELNLLWDTAGDLAALSKFAQ